jgi:hypothetical protein
MLNYKLQRVLDRCSIDRPESLFAFKVILMAIRESVIPYSP